MAKLKDTKSPYIEGPKARKRFEGTMTALFKAQKSVMANKEQKKSKKGKD